jgi:hypothetical protein
MSGKSWAMRSTPSAAAQQLSRKATGFRMPVTVAGASSIAIASTAGIGSGSTVGAA